MSLPPLAPTPSRWQKLGQQTITPTRIFDLSAARYRHPERKTEKDFYVIQSPDWVNVLAVTPDLQLVLVNQFRFGIDGLSLEIPGGIIDQDESPLDAGLRELREETGFVGGRARVLGSIHPNPAILNNRCHFVLVEQCTRTAELAWDPDEEITVTTEPIEAVYEKARNGGITHSLVLSALLLFAPRWEQLKQEKVSDSHLT